MYDVDGLTPFHAAIVSQSKECIDITLQLMSADRTILEIPSATGLTPLMLAIQRGNHQVHLQAKQYTLLLVCDVVIDNNNR